jgi:cytochrome c biogenesis protein CcmG/thiol:disulfide interchange protein DsbE
VKSWRLVLPLLVFVVLVVFLWRGLSRDPREVPSPLVGKPAPAFQLPQLMAPDKQLSVADMKGQVWLLNVWASWCGPCRDEHPHLVAFARTKQVPLVGLNYKDSRNDALGWLKEFGNPYDVSLSDLDGRVGIDFGVYGVPETFVIDKGGVIRFKHIGPLTPEVLRTKIAPLLKELNG